ncbi:MAG: alpha/beta-type small acid-soluble spore protein [Paenibacillus macerans]|uniref:alpha/beta-type small acid-soluble spore protein n=1 Tax=Paenibacillus TaxID=44249 RepID=UPI00055FB701|nr:alpha/beta-type small acid-soluble spore protein [Paenibacillus macerans]MBS5914130.1 alpha/beta-type small acid-soluble spore protein [Paenibacillus macerans]MCY7562259.1 alpha/beta-type small acid-soluble spore protein [Paenibacillus macerans]MDU5947627.1 alpha/beta-type small acid-soluble spore protein [Paenibacillus macerans]MDU7477699.1 alpha/beta-type small acid-soluble spore protein [Paenibacillus macerans]MEC0135483.1 alpha/beta-type small acid-soluble spore protein [Paenibacillus m
MAQNNNSSNDLVVRQASGALDQMKYEIAQELGISFPQDGYAGNLTSYENGSIGGFITKRLVTIAEQQLAGQAGQFR